MMNKKTDARSKGDTDMLRFNADAGLGIKVAMGGELQDTSVMLAIKDIEKQLDSAEKQRQLYVAMTRAQDRLILSGTYDSSSKSRSENWFSSLRNILQDYDQFLLKEYEAGKKGTAVKSAADLEQVLVTDELLQRIKPLPEYGLEWQRSLSATALQTYLDCPRCYYYQYILQMPGYEAVNAADASGYLPAALQGTVIHKALELLTNGYEQEPAFRTALQAYKVQGSAARTYDMYMQYINGPLYQRLQEAERKAEISFELPLLQEYGITAVFSGYIDCTVFNSDGTLTIVDYKTGVPPAAGEPAPGYIYQLALYQKAASELWQRPAALAELHFLQNNSCWQLQDCSDRLQEVAELCRDIFSKRRESEFTVKTKYCKNCPFAYFCAGKE